MEIAFLPRASEDLAYWKSTGNSRILKRIRALLADIQEHPFSGIGKPEPLKGENGNYILPFLWMRGEDESIMRAEATPMPETPISSRKSSRSSLVAKPK